MWVLCHLPLINQLALLWVSIFVELSYHIRIIHRRANDLIPRFKRIFLSTFLHTFMRRLLTMWPPHRILICLLLFLHKISNRTEYFTLIQVIHKLILQKCVSNLLRNVLQLSCLIVTTLSTSWVVSLWWTPRFLLFVYTLILHFLHIRNFNFFYHLCLFDVFIAVLHRFQWPILQYRIWITLLILSYFNNLILNHWLSVRILIPAFL